MVLLEKNIVNRESGCTQCSVAMARQLHEGSQLTVPEQRCLWFWDHLGTHQQMPQSQLLCTASAFIPTADLKGQDLSLTAIILKHLNGKVVRGLILLNLHILPLDKAKPL